MSARDCPPSERLADYVSGRLDDDVRESIGLHIDSCPICRQEMEKLNLIDDTLAGHLRSPLPEDSFRGEASRDRLPQFATGENPADSTPSRHSNSTSTSLLSLIRQRDSDAWNRFADLYSPLVYSWARRGGMRENDAADIVQEVFSTVALKIDDFGVGHEKSSFRGWLAAITRNQVRLYFRRLASRPEAEGGSNAALRMENVPDWDDDSIDEHSPEDQQYLLHRALQLIRGDFGETTWQAFWKTVVEEQSAPEVAAELRTTPGAVRQAKFRVLRRLRDAVE